MKGLLFNNKIRGLLTQLTEHSRLEAHWSHLLVRLSLIASLYDAGLAFFSVNFFSLKKLTFALIGTNSQ